MDNLQNNQKSDETPMGYDTLLGLVAVKDRQPTETGNYEITRDGKRFWKCHFDTYFGWAHLLNPELYYWRKCN
jgi:hypothetical protein